MCIYIWHYSICNYSFLFEITYGANKKTAESVDLGLSREFSDPWRLTVLASSLWGQRFKSGQDLAKMDKIQKF